MPELPEVETVRRQLESSILKKRIQSVQVRDPSILRQEIKDFTKMIEGNSFTSISRVGKLLIFHLSSGKAMTAHLKMTGQFLHQQAGVIQAGIFPLLYASTAGGKKTAGRFREDQIQQGLQVKHTHVLFEFEDGSVLAFRDVRKFGYLKGVSSEELQMIQQSYGIDPLDSLYTRENFHKAFERRQKPLKAVLMDQRLIAGIGNIYADEICHQTKLRPEKSAAKLSKKQLDELYYASSEILKNAVGHKGTTLRDFAGVDGEPGNFAFELKAYGRQGEPCLQCEKGVIRKITFQGRGTHYCPNCQR